MAELVADAGQIELAAPIDVRTGRRRSICVTAPVAFRLFRACFETARRDGLGLYAHVIAQMPGTLR